MNNNENTKNDRTDADLQSMWTRRVLALEAHIANIAERRVTTLEFGRAVGIPAPTLCKYLRGVGYPKRASAVRQFEFIEKAIREGRFPQLKNTVLSDAAMERWHYSNRPAQDPEQMALPTSKKSEGHWAAIERKVDRIMAILERIQDRGGK